MKPDSELTKRITSRLNEYFNGQLPDPHGYLSIAREMGALPVYYGWTGFLALRPDGAIMIYDEDSGIAIEGDPIWVRIALSAAVAKYDELIDLLPSRPSEAKDCGVCNGTGIPYSPCPDLKCGECGSWGWID